MTKSNYIICIMILLTSLPCLSLQAQTDKEKPTAQPSIMVIPFARADQSLRSVYEKSDIVRIAITKVKEGFDQRTVNTIDFRAKLKQAGNNEILQEEQAGDLKDAVIANSGADVYVEVDANVHKTSTGNSVSVILTAYDAYSGESLANKVSNSPKMYTDNMEKLTEKAIEFEIDNLLNTIQEKFTDMINNGRSVNIQIGVAENSDLRLDAEDPETYELLSDKIESWVESNSLKSQYRLQGVTPNRMTFDLVKVPIKDENGNNYRVAKLAQAFRGFMRENKIACQQVIQGNNLVFTLSKI